MLVAQVPDGVDAFEHVPRLCWCVGCCWLLSLRVVDLILLQTYGVITDGTFCCLLLLSANFSTVPVKKVLESEFNQWWS